MKFAFIAKHRGIWQTQLMCRTLGVSRAGFYEWLRRTESDRAEANRELLALIRDSFEQSDRKYGSPRVWRDLIAWGYRCSQNRVARLMFTTGLQARRKRRRLPEDIDRSARALHRAELARSAVRRNSAEPTLGRCANNLPDPHPHSALSS